MVKRIHTGLDEQRNEAPLLDVRAVSFSYGNTSLLCDISLEVASGEMLGLLGPNGSGKTTLLRLLSGTLRAQQGEIVLEGRSMHSWGRRAVAQRIAVVPQELHVPFAFSVEHLVGLGRTPFIDSFWGTFSKRDWNIVRDAMQATGIVPLAQRVFNELSGGERQRVLIAMALAQQPALLLLDEPTAHLDLKYQIETLELVQQLHRERGVTIIAAIHDLNLAARYFPRLLLFQRGIVADGSPSQVLDPGLLSRVYGIDVRVGIMRGARHLSILPPDNEPDENQSAMHEEARVHVLAGGGSGELLMRALADAHIPFSAGPLSRGDSDYALALRLASNVITEQPYAPISQGALEQLRATLATVDALILTPFPTGPGNLSVHQEALDAVRRGVRVYLLEAGNDMNDYTGGPGERLIEEVLRKGAIKVKYTKEAINGVSGKIVGEPRYRRDVL